VLVTRVSHPKSSQRWSAEYVGHFITSVCYQEKSSQTSQPWSPGQVFPAPAIFFNSIKFKYLFLIGTQALIFVHDLIILMVHMKSVIMSMFSYVGFLDG
jgi:hypothetical protein